MSFMFCFIHGRGHVPPSISIRERLRGFGGLFFLWDMGYGGAHVQYIHPLNVTARITT